MTTLENIKYNSYFFVHVLILDSYILVRTSYCIKASLVFGSSVKHSWATTKQNQSRIFARSQSARSRSEIGGSLICAKINRHIKELKSSLDSNNGPKAKHYMSRLFFHQKACSRLYASHRMSLMTPPWRLLERDALTPERSLSQLIL